MSGSANLGNLKTEKWQQLQEIADRFETAWKNVRSPAEPPDLAAFLPPPDDPLRPTAVQELVKIDLEIHWRYGNIRMIESYLERLPELGTSDQVSPQLIYEEYTVRHKYGDRPSVESYKVRFPGRFDDFQRLLREQPVPTMATAVPTPSYRPAAGQSPPARAAAAPAPPEVGAAREPAIDLPPGYEPVKPLGKGGFGEVWEALAPGKVPVAIKIIFRPIDDEESRRELESLEIVKKLRHPYLLATHNFQVFKNRLYIVMELAEGNLRVLAKECREAGMPGIPLPELITYFHESAEALDYLQKHKVLHRDIKPDNILTLAHHTKLADFGLARLHESERSMNASGSGTPPYMAPEVWNGKVCPASDQYSLAMTYAELRLNRRLFAGNDMVQIMHDHLTATPKLAPLPEPEQQVLLRALAKNHTERFPNNREFVKALAEALGPQIGGTGRISIPAGAPAGGGLSATDAANIVTLDRPQPGAPSAGATEANQGVAESVPGLPQSREERRQPMSATAELRPSRPAKPVQPPARRRLILYAIVLFCFVIGASLTALKLHRSHQIEPKKSVDGTPPEVDFLPPHCRGAEGAEIVTVNRRRYYNRIDYQVDEAFPAEGMHIRLVLIPQRQANDPPTFYMMEDKVSVGLFKQFAKAFDKEIGDSEWRGDNFTRLNAKDRYPVVSVVVEDAWRFANRLGGDLPSPRQWDKAAGEFEEPRGDGPYLPSFGPQGAKQAKKAQAKSWFPLPGLEPIVLSGDDDTLLVPREMAKPGDKIQDVSPLGTRYLAGNGREFTNATTLFGDPPDKVHRVPLPDDLRKKALTSARKFNRPFAFVTIRGATFHDVLPYRFDNKKLPNYTGSVDYFKPYDDVGFRMVLEEPE